VKKISNVRPSPLFRDDGPAGARVIRRFRGITLEVIAFVLVTVLLPALLVGAALVDLALWLRRRKPWVAVRLMAFLWWFLFGEMRALAAIFDEAAPGPVMVMMRHASIIDNMLPDTVVSRTHGIGLRYVIKRELQVIPTIDIGGRWVPTNFVRRASGDADAEISRLLQLAHDLHEGEGILIYPEGTRFTPAKLQRAKEIVRERQPELAELANGLEHLLPPRLGGPLALINEAPHVDVVFCGHVGFDGFQHISDVWAGELVGSVIGIKFWRVPAAEIPEDEAARAEWLFGQWQRMDDWIDSKIKRSDAEQGRFTAAGG
jgi:1-acyl-sn-glycerol-3-phosphate acyltransferase